MSTSGLVPISDLVFMSPAAGKRDIACFPTSNNTSNLSHKADSFIDENELDDQTNKKSRTKVEQNEFHDDDPYPLLGSLPKFAHDQSLDKNSLSTSQDASVLLDSTENAIMSSKKVVTFYDNEYFNSKSKSS
jgi:hypothetical protein